MGSKPGLKNVIKNSVFLFSGSSVASIFGLLSAIILARYFGQEKYGILALLQACTVVVRGFFSTQSWQAVIRFGVKIFDSKHENEFLAIAKITLIVEISTAFIAGTFAIFMVIFFNNLWGLPDAYVKVGVLYCLIIFLNFTDYFTGIFRLFEKFNLISAHMIFASLIRFFFTLLIWTLKLSFIPSLYLLACSEIIKNLTFIVMGIHVFNRKTPISFSKLIISPPISSCPLKEVTSFLAPIWMWSTLRMLPRELDIFVLGGLAGTSSVGLYKIAKQIASVLSRFYTPFYQTIFPDINIMKHNNSYQDLKNLVVRSSGLIFLVSLIAFSTFFVFGKFIISYALGQTYIISYWPAVLYLLALLIFSISISFIPFLFSTANERYVMNAYFFSLIIYIPMLLVLSNRYDIYGASLAFVIFNLMSTILITKKTFTLFTQPLYSKKNIYEKFTF